MNAILNEIQLWFCDICDETNKFASRLKHINAKTDTREKEYGTVVKEYEFFNSDCDEVNYILNDKNKDSSKKTFLLV